jgi:hypothetical protein
MRVNIEDDLILSGRLNAVAARMDWTQREAVGSLYFLWRRTQNVEIVTCSRDQLLGLIRLDYDNDDDASRFIDVCVSVGLISEDGSEVTIKGNEQHVSRISSLRKRARSGGFAKASKSVPTGRQQAASRHGQGTENSALPTPSSLLPTPYNHKSKKEEEIHPISEKTPIGQIRAAFLVGYAARYNGKSYHWGLKYNGQAKNILKNWPLATVLDLVPKFFAWSRPEVIRAGHPFGNGPHSFVFRIDELYADTHTPERRLEAEVVRANEHEGMRRAEGMAQSQRIEQAITSTEPQALLEGGF